MTLELLAGTEIPGGWGGGGGWGGTIPNITPSTQKDFCIQMGIDENDVIV